MSKKFDTKTLQKIQKIQKKTDESLKSLIQQKEVSIKDFKDVIMNFLHDLSNNRLIPEGVADSIRYPKAIIEREDHLSVKKILDYENGKENFFYDYSLGIRKEDGKDYIPTKWSAERSDLDLILIKEFGICEDNDKINIPKIKGFKEKFLNVMKGVFNAVGLNDLAKACYKNTSQGKMSSKLKKICKEAKKTALLIPKQSDKEREQKVRLKYNLDKPKVNNMKQKPKGRG